MCRRVVASAGRLTPIRAGNELHGPLHQPPESGRIDWMSRRFQFSLRNLFCAMTLVGIGYLVFQFVNVGVPYWWSWDDGEAAKAKLEELRQLRALESELPLGPEKGRVLMRRLELEAQVRDSID
jgi:hypothetical protein